MKELKVCLYKEKDGTFSMYIDGDNPLPYGLVGEGETVEEAIREWNKSYYDMKEIFMSEGKEFEDVHFEYTYDVPSFLAYYGSLFTFRGLAKLTGVSAAQLSQYASGYRNPSSKTTYKIQEALRRFGSDLSHISLA